MLREEQAAGRKHVPILHNAPLLVGANALNSVLKGIVAWYVQLHNKGVVHIPLSREKWCDLSPLEFQHYSCKVWYLTMTIEPLIRLGPEKGSSGPSDLSIQASTNLIYSKPSRQPRGYNIRNPHPTHQSKKKNCFSWKIP